MTNNYSCMSILIVEDDEDDFVLLQELLEDSLGEIGVIDWAVDTKSAIEYITHKNHQMYFIDNRLGAELGLDLIVRIKQKHEISPLIIMLSGVDDRLTDLKAMDNGADDYLIKSQLSPLLLERTIRYIIKSKVLEEKLARLAHFDGLTGLYNRSIFNELLNKSIEQSKRSHRKLALVTIDLDDFKHINDNYGHPAGDLLLTKISRRLKHKLRSSDIVARTGGDEFSIVLKEVDDSRHFLKLIEAIMQVFVRPIQVLGHDINATISAGIAIFPNDASDSRELIEHSDRAMYQAKNKGKNTYSFYNQDLHQQAKYRHSIEVKLASAIEDGSLMLYYQPILDLQTQKIISYEALLRWKNEKGVFYDTEEVIAIAEQGPLILQLGIWVFDTACEQLMQWQQQRQFEGRFAINVSAKQFNNSNFSEHVITKLTLYPQLINKLTFEITERNLLESHPKTIELLEKLVALGCEFSIDDFGTGHSSISYLRTFPMQIIKIDKSIVQHVLDENKELAICKAIIAIGKALDIVVIAEGIEDKEVADKLLKLHCPQAQGYYYSRPMAQDQL
ncbi:MAG: EAL domain-containing protein [Oceanospirillaceae bacterium]|nr:EAL domain-containing protein [Oceanospirillaceae bacterium]